MADKLSYKDFTLACCRIDGKGLVKEGYTGFHSIYGGYRATFNKYYGKPDNDVSYIKVLTDLASQGVIVSRPAKKGVMIYDPKNYTGDTADKILAKMGLK